MKKNLNTLDFIYKSVNEHMETTDKIAYCESLVSSTEIFLQANSERIDDDAKKKYHEIINAAVAEIQLLRASIENSK